MAEYEELAALLARTAALGVGAPAPAMMTPEETLGRILGAIRGVVLPRDLTLHAESGPCLRISAAGGSVIMVLESQLAGAEALLQRPLRANSGEDLRGFADMLQDLCTGREITITAALPNDPPDPMHTGLPAQALLTHLGLAPFAAAVPDEFAYFRDAAEDVILAVYDLRGVTPIRPGFETPAALAASIDRVLASDDGPLQEVAPGDMLFLGLVAEPDLAIGLARPGGDPVALVFEADCLADMASFWSGLLHGTVTFEA